MGVIGNKFRTAFLRITIPLAYGFAFGHAFIFFRLPLVMFFCALTSAPCYCITIPVVFHYVFMLLNVVAVLIVLKFIKGMIKFAVLAILALAALYMAGVFN